MVLEWLVVTLADLGLLDDWFVKPLKNSAHFLDINFFFFELQVLFVVLDVLLEPVPELLLVLVALDVAGRHDAHDLVVVLEDAEPGQFCFVVQEHTILVL